MRTFDERKAEIFRRSAERIAARRKAVKIGTGCVATLLLCLCLLPLFPNQGEEGSGIQATGAAEQYTDNTNQLLIANPDRVSLLLSQIMNKPTTDGYKEEVVNPEAMEPKPTPEAVPNGGEEVKAEVYTFVLENRTYTLAGMVLTDCKTKQEYLLTAGEYRDLKTALGITQ